MFFQMIKIQCVHRALSKAIHHTWSKQKLKTLKGSSYLLIITEFLNNYKLEHLNKSMKYLYISETLMKRLY